MKRAKRAESAPNARSASRNSTEQKQIHNSAPEVGRGEASVDDERETLSKIHKLEKSITEKSQITDLPVLISVCQVRMFQQARLLRTEIELTDGELL